MNVPSVAQRGVKAVDRLNMAADPVWKSVCLALTFHLALITFHLALNLSFRSITVELMTNDSSHPLFVRHARCVARGVTSNDSFESVR